MCPKDSAVVTNKNHGAFLEVPENINFDNLENVLDCLHNEILTTKNSKAIIQAPAAIESHLDALHIFGARVLALYGTEMNLETQDRN